MAMRSQATWSVSLGRWGSLHVRLHCFFLLFAACTLFLALRSTEPNGNPLPLAGVSLGLLAFSVIVHELGHYVAARRLGGGGDEIVIGPLGGLSPMRPPADPYAECLMHLAGPFTNFCVCLFAGSMLILDGPSWPGLLNPFRPQGIDSGMSWLVVGRLAFWINWLLLLVNLLPAFPFDGGRALRAALVGAAPDSSPKHAAHIVGSIAKIAAVGLAIAALLMFGRDVAEPRVVPVWFPLLLLAIFLYFSAKQEEDRSDPSELDDRWFAHPDLDGHASGEESVAHVRQWVQEQEAKQTQRRDEEEEDERRVDEILERLHQRGMNSISEEDRLLLKRVSARYRERHRS